jgi:hypothetical protein
MSLIYTLILFFIFLLVYQIYLDIYSGNLIEGLETNSSPQSSSPSLSPSSSQEFKPYNLNNNNSLILSQQNAGNIEVLQGRIDTLDGMNKKVDNIQLSLDTMQVQIDSLVQPQTTNTQELNDLKPLSVIGTDNFTLKNLKTTIKEEEEN